jgi:collagenase-like PrtC family protease
MEQCVWVIPEDVCLEIIWMEDKPTKENVRILADLNTKYDSKKNADQENFSTRRRWKYVHILSSKDLCTIDRLAELNALRRCHENRRKIKIRILCWSVVKAYKHVRDAIIAGKPIDENYQKFG